MTLWKEFDLLQKKKAELDSQLLSISEKEKTLEDRLRIVEARAQEEMALQEENIHNLELRLKEKHEAIDNLESKIAYLEEKLKKPMKEEPQEEFTMAESETQSIKVNTQEVFEDDQKQNDEQKQNNDQKQIDEQAKRARLLNILLESSH